MLANIKRLCTVQGLTIQQLEERAQISAGTIGRWGRDGKLMPSVDKVKRVADTLGVTVDELLKEEEAETSAKAAVPAGEAEDGGAA